MTDQQIVQPEQVLHGHTSDATAYVVDDYPYGRSRTQKRYWIETKSGQGDRLVTQTLNPKTGRWNKPKMSTYSNLLALFLDPQDDGRAFVSTYGIGVGRKTEEVQRWIATVGLDNLNDVQRAMAAYMIGANKVMEHVTWSVRVGPETPEQAVEQAEIKANIAKAIRGASVQAHRELNAQ